MPNKTKKSIEMENLKNMKSGIQNQIIKDRNSPKNRSAITSPSNKNCRTSPSSYLKGKMFGDLLISQQEKERQSLTLH